MSFHVKKANNLNLRVHRVSNRRDKDKLTPRHVIMKFKNIKDKEKILKASRD